jgi:NADH dehydrogenase/NADH:ubiquinone oxidoreductase subunit G
MGMPACSFLDATCPAIVTDPRRAMVRRAPRAHTAVELAGGYDTRRFRTTQIRERKDLAVKKSLITAALVVSLSAVAVACDDEEDATPTPEPTAAAAEQVEEAVETVEAVEEEVAEEAEATVEAVEEEVAEEVEEAEATVEAVEEEVAEESPEA